MKAKFLFLILISLTHTMANSQPNTRSADSFEDFKKLLLEVEKFRKERLITLDSFLAMSKDQNTIILDTRSDFRYDRKHLEYARHLAFTDFTQANLAKIIPDFNTRVLIYCNNNFTGDQIDFATKKVEFDPVRNGQFASQAKPTLLALNIPTFITLYGYGYNNVYELTEVVDVKDPRIKFDGSLINPGEFLKK
jgi:hypothetical protein